MDQAECFAIQAEGSLREQAQIDKERRQLRQEIEKEMGVNVSGQAGNQRQKRGVTQAQHPYVPAQRLESSGQGNGASPQTGSHIGGVNTTTTQLQPQAQGQYTAIDNLRTNGMRRHRQEVGSWARVSFVVVWVTLLLIATDLDQHTKR
jgi:hypothetical protein